MTDLQAHLRNIGACGAGLDFAGDKSAEEVWATCQRPDWLGWWLAKTNTEPQNRRLAKLYCRIWNDDITPLLPESERPGFTATLTAIGNWCDDPTEEKRKRARALALARALGLARALDLALARTLGLALGLDLALALALDLARALGRDFDLALARARDLALDRALGRDLDLALARARDLALDRALNKKWCEAIRAEFQCPLATNLPALPEQATDPYEVEGR